MTDDIIIFKIEESPDNAAAAQALTTKLQRVGVRATVTGDELILRIDSDKIKSVTTRNAGRRGQAAQHGAELLTIPEVYRYAQGHTAAETARYCRLSLRTYQRRIAEYKRLNIWNECGGEGYRYF